MFEERRREPREPLALPVTLADGAGAVTRDISSSGMYLQISGHPELDATMFFEMRLDEARMMFTAEGRIVRIERGADRTGIALRLTCLRLEPLA